MSIWKPKICLIGDSTMITAPIFLQPMTKAVITNLSVSGGNTAGQVAQWNLLTTEQKQAFDYVLIQIGLNDLGVGAKTAAQLIPEIQALFDLIYVEKSTNCNIISSTMTPARGSFGDIAYVHWLAVNEAYRGQGATPFNHADLYCDYHTTKLNDGDGYLRDELRDDTLSEIHANLIGREYCADSYREVIDFIYYQAD